jgi:hypothetical protein
MENPNMLRPFFRIENPDYRIYCAPCLALSGLILSTFRLSFSSNVA